jgi:glycosyltransferase involved in cell wall biosynthesis
MPPLLSLVVPAWNEARRLPPTLLELARFARTQTGGVEVLVVVEQSPDGTLEIARELARQQADSSVRIEVIDSGPQRGKGHAVRTGMLRAQGEIVFYMDADLSVPLSEVPPFLAAFAAQPETAVLLGNRQHARSRITRAQSWLRRSMGQIFNRILGALGLAAWHDTQCGFKAFRREACRRIFAQQRIDGFAFDVEVLLLAQRQGWQIRDLPVEWINSPESRVRIVRDSLRMLWDAIRVRWAR